MAYLVIAALLLFNLYDVYKKKKSKSDFLKLNFFPLIALTLILIANDLAFINSTVTLILLIPIAIYYFYITGGLFKAKK